MSAVLHSPASCAASSPRPLPWEWGRNPELCIYRDRTIALLRRFLRLSMDTGRLPSLLGRQFFRAKVSSYRMVTFEDAVIFVHDIEKCLEQLDDFSRAVIARVVLQEYTQEETAQMLHRNRRTIGRKLHEALDHLSEIFIRTGLLCPMRRRNN
jgi:sigma-70-like protein